MNNYSWDIIYWIEVVLYGIALVAYLIHSINLIDSKQTIDYSNITCFTLILLSIVTKFTLTITCLIGIESQGLTLYQYG